MNLPKILFPYCLLIAIFCFGCEGESGFHEQNSSPKVEDSPSKYSQGRLLDSNFIDNEVFTFFIDTTPPQREDTLYLSVNAELDEKGRIAFDDGNIWSVFVSNGLERNLLYQNDIQLGRVEVYYEKSLETIFIVEIAPYQQDTFRIDLKNGSEVKGLHEIPETFDYRKLVLQ